MKTAYPQTHTTCSIRLYSNIPFDNSYSNHSLISDNFKYNNVNLYTYGDAGSARERFINRRDYSKTGKPYYYPRYDMTGEFNFDFTNGLVGAVILELTAAQTNANYLRLTCGNDVYYYFVTGISQINADTYRLSLELDVIMTYQYEFLEGIKNTPVFTQRKHCFRYTNNGLMPHCCDLKSGEDIFANVKPSLIWDVYKLHYDNAQMKNIEGVMWLYICLDRNAIPSTYLESFLYTCKGKSYPLIMLAIPLGVNSLTYKKTDNTFSYTYSKDDLTNAITLLIGDGSVHGAKISPYPPFSPSGVTTLMSLDNSGNLTIASPYVQELIEGEEGINVMTVGNNTLLYGGMVGDVTIFKLITKGCIVLNKQDDTKYEYKDLTASQLYIANEQQPSVTANRYHDPKLMFSPFKKYKICSQYSSEGSEFFPELLFSEYATASNGHYFAFDTTATGYIGDNNFYTKISTFGDSNIDTYTNYKYDKVGLANAVNYIFPCGTNALDVFNATQSQSFYTSKVASGITSGISIAGGVVSMGMGIAGTLPTAGASALLIASGATAIAGGVAGVSNSIASSLAKVEDLKNTPDSINISGSNFITDECVTGDTNGLPYIIMYEASSVIRENADDYFYNYGYQVARECYFNLELKINNDTNHKVDTDLFTRDIFNYIQLNEDITNKINADIPLIVKQKLSSVFNKGITLWSWFGFPELWDGDPADPTSTYYLDRWFLKCTLDNTEVRFYKGD